MGRQMGVVALLKKILIAAGFLAFASTSVNAQTFNFDGGPNSGTSVSTLSFSSGGVTTTVTGYSFSNTLGPASLGGFNINSSTFTSNVTLSYSNRGVGICSPTETGGTAGNSAGCPEIDSADEQGRRKTNFNEGLLVAFTGVPTVNILGAVLNIVDDNDTLGIYGVAVDGTLELLGFSGTILNPTGGFTVAGSQTNTNAQYSLTFNPVLSGFSRYLFTTMTNGTTSTTGDGYRLRSMTVAAVPEPATWAMMLFGFGFIGFQLRRSRRRANLTFGTKGLSGPGELKIA